MKFSVLEVVGPGGRGKSTFANLCCALVGARNYASTTLNQLEQSRFEVASIKGKRLTLINDSERYGGSAQIFKALTGGDNLRFEEKNKMWASLSSTQEWSWSAPTSRSRRLTTPQD